ncbi:MAG: gas vesicle protein [Polyangiaceae bacterium]|nr:gas vesicle protein [Polyangiaceae bacterium]
MREMATRGSPPPTLVGRGSDLADILERVLDKGVVIAGDIQVKLLDIELLTIKVRLLIAGVDKAREMGISWWEQDPFLTSGGRAVANENKLLREEVEQLKEQLLELEAGIGAAAEED